MSNKFKKVIEVLKNDLEDGLLFCDVWSKDTDLSVASFNPNEKYTALFGRVTKNMEKALNDLGFPEFGEFQIIDLEADSLLIILNLKKDFLLGGLIDKSEVTLGILLNIAIPNALAAFKA
jgi:hypothetical protein